MEDNNASLFLREKKAKIEKACLVVRKLKEVHSVSFTQNLSSVLLDPKRSRTEIQTFFTRHWGDSFVPKNRIPPTPSLPTILEDHFKKYLDTTTKKYKRCMKAKCELQRTLARHEEDTRIDAEDIPKILLDPYFSLADPTTFEAVFLEPVNGETDSLYVNGKLSTAFLDHHRCASDVSLTPSSSSNSIEVLCKTYEAANGRYFRPYDGLQKRLEFYHDLVDTRLNNQLALKSNAFWKTVISCGSLNSELADALGKVALIRKSLQEVDNQLYHRIKSITNIFEVRKQHKKLLDKLREKVKNFASTLCATAVFQDIACLRDAQLTVQTLLNQNDYPKALECIDTAQDVLNNELRGVICFRHLDVQLHELHRVIARMLYEEFVTLVQKELSRPCESENDVAYQEGQLNPIVIGLLQVKEYRFIHVLQQEIVITLKNLLRQIIKAHVVQSVSDDGLTEFDPSLGNLCTQMRRLNFDQWFTTLRHVLHVFYLMCCRVQSIQEIILDNTDHFLQVLSIRSKKNQEVIVEKDLTQESSDMKISSNPANEPSTLVETCACENFEKTATELKAEKKNVMEGIASGTKTSVCNPELDVEQGIGDAEKLLDMNQHVPSNEQDSDFLSESNTLNTILTAPAASTPAAFLSMPCRHISQIKLSVALLTEHAAYSAQERSSRLLVARSKDGFLERLSLSEFDNVLRAIREFVNNCDTLIGTEKKFSNPLEICVLQQSNHFIKKFHEDRKNKLSSILDTETWRVNEVPEHFQRLADLWLQKNRLTDVGLSEQEHVAPSKPNLIVGKESYVAVGTVFILLQTIAQYCDALEVLPEYSSELLMHVVELLKNYNSRSCQLILGAGALQLIGLKSISVRHLALSSRCLQLVLRFVPFIRDAFQEKLPADKLPLLRHIDQLVRDYSDHAQEIVNKLITVIDHHLDVQLQTWEVKGSIPSPTFQHMCRQLGKFYNGLTGIMPESMIKELFLRVHENFKKILKIHLNRLNISPHDSLTYGWVSQEYWFYIKSLQSMPCCSDLREESISEALFSKN
ncbi:unnamed protein product [Thelazia callipaeda]|uniref:Vps54 domain-containing protein n=1 Tax=Thelazia callipaeda TaxID=103827 RepID=A0A0N5DA63_THECL|nr:unnamed protein product [Thelazia callipaeda]